MFNDSSIKRIVRCCQFCSLLLVVALVGCGGTTGRSVSRLPAADAAGAARFGNLPLERNGERISVPFPVAVVVDGDLNEWSGMPFTAVERYRYRPDNPLRRPALSFALAADASFLYIGFEVRDPDLVPPPDPAQLWLGDTLEINLDWTGATPTEYVPGTAQLYAVLPAADDVAGTLVVAQGQPAAPTSALYRTEGTWGGEIAIPFNGQIVPRADGTFGFAVTLNSARRLSDGSAEADAQLYWSSRDVENIAWKNPAVFGVAHFYRLPESLPMSATADLPPPAGSNVVVSPLWRGVVRATWDGFKRYYITCGAECGDNRGLVFDPSLDYIAVSEGTGYGLLLAVMLDDQPTFDLLYDAAHRDLLDRQTGLLHWRANPRGEVVGEGSASDADADIAAALIFAQARVERGEWAAHTTLPYRERALQLLDSLYRHAVAPAGWLRPGPDVYWSPHADDIVNLSYFAPAWYRLYDRFEGSSRWSPLIDPGYALLEAQPGAALGLAPDWMTPQGTPATDVCLALGQPLNACGFDMSFDALRVYWRLATDCLWFDEARACAWNQRAVAFLRGHDDAQFARVYTLTGETLLDYQNEAMLGMWLTAALSVGDQQLTDRIALSLYNLGDPVTNGHWWLEPRFYYNHALALLGAVLYTGQFQDIAR